MILIYFFIFIFGLIIGSFLNCLVWRLHKKETILGRSYCPQCHHQLSWHDNIPLLSYILLGGKCRYCRKSISRQYPAVELVTGLLFVLAFYLNFNLLDISQVTSMSSTAIGDYKLQVISLIRDWFLISVMIIIFIIDLRWYLILDIVTLPSSLIVLFFNLAIAFYKNNGILPNASWQGLLFSGIIGSSFFLLQFIISRGKWIGGGDIRLGLLMGLALGWPKIAVAIFLAYIIGSIAGLALIATGKKQWGSKLPLGVFLTSATVISLFWGDALVLWYLNLLR